MPARAIDQHTRERARVLYRAGRIVREIASELGVSGAFVSGLATDEDREVRAQALSGGGAARAGSTPVSSMPDPPKPLASSLPPPDAIAGGPSLPEAHPCEYKPFLLDTPGATGILADVHIPYHDVATIESYLADCKRMNVGAILLNGDILDFYQLSDYLRDPSKPRMREEILKGRQFLAYLRATFPHARIVYKLGNHDERLRNYLARKAPDIFELEELSLTSLLHCKEYGVEVVEDKRLVMVGKLPVIHGHEYRGGGGVMPARWLYLRTGESAMMGHFHQPTFYSFRSITGKEVGMWSLGCACFLAPLYAPLNQWAHGWAIAETTHSGDYHIHNRRRLRSGQVV